VPPAHAMHTVGPDGARELGEVDSNENEFPNVAFERDSTHRRAKIPEEDFQQSFQIFLKKEEPILLLY
jgi:hypothetical protein